MPYDKPNVGDFKAYFNRDFPYGDEEAGPQGGPSAPLDFVLGADIQKGLDRASFMVNPDLATDQTFYTEIYLLLSAHIMVMNLRTSSQGVGSQPEWLRTGKAAGSVSEGFQIPERISANPELALLTRTGYGQQYLELILPQLSGQMFVVVGRTLP